MYLKPPSGVRIGFSYWRWLYILSMGLQWHFLLHRRTLSQEEGGGSKHDSCINCIICMPWPSSHLLYVFPVRHGARSVYQSLNRSLKSYVNGYRLISMHAYSIHRLGLGSQTRSFDSISFSKALIINDRPSTELCIICTGQQRIQFIKYLIILFYL